MARIIGTGGDDNLVGDGNDDRIEGRDGDDMLWGEGGADTLIGGAGNDFLIGGNVSDKLDGGEGDDQLWLMDGIDTGIGGAGDDVILAFGGSNLGPVIISGGDGGDRIDISTNEGLYAFAVNAGADNDLVDVMGARATSINLGAGADLAILRDADNTLKLGEGHDVVQLTSLFAQIRLKDFAATGDSADSLALGHLLAFNSTWDKVGNPFASGHLRLVQKGADVHVQFDPNGHAGSGGPWTIVKLKEVQVADLTAASFHGYAPDASAVQGAVYRGGDVRDVLLGGGGDDLVTGGRADDWLNGGFGDDLVRGGAGADWIEDDSGGSDRLFGDAGDDVLQSDRFNVFARENDDRITLDGGAGKDQLHHLGTAGSQAHVTMLGGSGDDHFDLNAAVTGLIVGGTGADSIYSAAQSTRVAYASVAESTAAAFDRFVELSESIVIDLSQTDANAAKAGNQAFVLVGGLSGQAGELALRYDTGADTTWIEGDVNGDGAADLVISVAGEHTDFTGFIL